MFDKEIFTNWAQQYGPPEILDEESQQMNLNEQLQQAYSAGYYRALNERRQQLNEQPSPPPPGGAAGDFFERAGYPDGGYWDSNGYYHWHDYVFINGAWAAYGGDGGPGGVGNAHRIKAPRGQFASSSDGTYGGIAT